MLTAELISFIQGGVAIMVATRNNQLLSTGTRGYGIYVHEDQDELTVYVNEEAFKLKEFSLSSNKELSLAIARPTDYRAIQIKGKYLGHRNIDDRDKRLIECYTSAFIDQVVKASADRLPYLRMPSLPAFAVRMKIEVIFNQTPGASAGDAII